GVAGIDAHALQHADEAFPGENRAVERVAGAIEADHEAVADEHVVAHPLEIRDVLDAGKGGSGASAGDKREKGERGDGETVTERAVAVHDNRRVAGFWRSPCESHARAAEIEFPGVSPGFADP